MSNSSVDGLRLTVSVSWEPRVRPISLQQALARIEATDDRGESLTIDESRTAGNRGSLTASAENGISEIELGIPISLPDRASRTIASLKGELTALVPGSVETFEFEDFGESRDVELQKAGVTVTFERMRRNVDLYELRMNVRFDEAADALESHRGWVFGNESYVVDWNGQKVDNVGFQATRQNPDEVGVAYLFALPDGPRGCKFVYKTPATIMRLPVTWEIKDIDLP